MFVLRFQKIMLSFLSMDSGPEGCVFYWIKCTVFTASPANCSVEERVQRGMTLPPENFLLQKDGWKQKNIHFIHHIIPFFYRHSCEGRNDGGRRDE
jgi:hypothetical protein